GLGLVMAFIGTYTFRWTWTGFYSNTLWDWLHLLIVPAALGLGTMWLTQHHTWRTTGSTLVWSVLLILAVLEIATYLFNWHWTGFKGNTLWDWMNLLLLPLVLTLVSFWFSAPRLWLSWWTTLIWLSLVVLALLILNSEVFDWTWTGFI